MDDKTLLAAIENIMDKKLEPINTRLDIMQSDINNLKSDVGSLKSDIISVKGDIATMKEDIEQVKEDAAATRVTANGLGKWAELAADALKIRYPVKYEVISADNLQQ